MRYISQILCILIGAAVGTVTAPQTMSWFEQSKTSGRTPEIKINLGDTQAFIWKSTIAPHQKGSAGLPLHRHEYARVLIPLTEGTLVRKDKDGKTTEYALSIGKPLPLPKDTATGFHTDENFGHATIELLVLQFNQSAPVTTEPLTQADITAALK